MRDIRQHVNGKGEIFRVELFKCANRQVKAIVFDHFVPELSRFMPIHVHPNLAHEFWLKTGHPTVTGVVFDGLDVIPFAQWNRDMRNGVWSVKVGTGSYTTVLTSSIAPYLQHQEMEELKAS
jgi:hypothetical protein